MYRNLRSDAGLNMFQSNAALARQMAPSPDPIVEAKREIVNLQQHLSFNDQNAKQLLADISKRDQLIDQLKVSIH